MSNALHIVLQELKLHATPKSSTQIMKYQNRAAEAVNLTDDYIQHDNPERYNNTNAEHTKTISTSGVSWIFLW